MHPIPSSLAHGEILVEIRLTTICGSDLHTMDGRRSEPVPSILGHEGLGVITELGPQPHARAQLTRGDRITWSMWPLRVLHGIPFAREVFVSLQVRTLLTR